MKPQPVQLPLDFDPPKVRHTDPKTSKNAIKGLNFKGIRLQILRTIFMARKPLATFQIAEVLEVSRDSVSPHMKPLERSKHLKRTGQTVANPNSARRVQSETWALTEQGIEYVSTHLS